METTADLNISAWTTRIRNSLLMTWSVILEEWLQEERETVTESICPKGKLGSSLWHWRILQAFRAEKRTAQLIAHPQLPYLRAQVIMQAAMVCNGWKQRRTVIRYARMSLGWFIYTWQSLPLPAERLSCLYIQWVAYKYAICKECL